VSPGQPEQPSDRPGFCTEYPKSGVLASSGLNKHRLSAAVQTLVARSLTPLGATLAGLGERR